MEFEFYTCDVFTDKAFGGNQLAVLPYAEGLTDKQMQQIAREFNFSESSFVFPSKNEFTKKVRIFTPVREVPFAGHPNIGTAFVLASIGKFGAIENSVHITFEEKAGPVEIDINKQLNDKIYCELKAPEELSTGIEIPVEAIVQSLSLSADDINIKNHKPLHASVGLPFVLVELSSLQALQKIKTNLEGFDKIAEYGIRPSVHVYIRSNDEFDIRARMFAPLSGVPEDPATGSANCALSAFLTSLRSEQSGTFEYKIAQGFEIGRPSILKSHVEKKEGKIVSTFIGGEAVLICKGTIFV